MVLSRAIEETLFVRVMMGRLYLSATTYQRARDFIVDQVGRGEQKHEISEPPREASQDGACRTYDDENARLRM